MIDKLKKLRIKTPIDIKEIFLRRKTEVIETITEYITNCKLEI